MHRHARTVLSLLISLWPVTHQPRRGHWNVCAPSIIATGRASVMFGAGPATQLDLATVHLAMHDAIQAYDHRFEPYAGAIAAGAGGSAFAAAARAAHTVLLTLFPAQQAAIDACYATSMTGIVLSPDDLIASDAVGNTAASNVLSSRNGDGSFPPSPIAPFTGGTAPGQWRPNPGTASMVAPWLGAVRPMALESVQRCQPDDLPALTSIEYAEAYNEVKALGSNDSTERTADQGHRADVFGHFSGQFNRDARACGRYIGGMDLAAQATARACSPSQTRRPPMRSSARGTRRRGSTSGGRTRRFATVTTTATC